LVCHFTLSYPIRIPKGNKIYNSCGKIGYWVVAMGKKIKTSIALDEDLLNWIDDQIKIKRFANRTHAIEYALFELKRKLEGEKVKH